MTLGERLAKTALTHLYGKKYACDAPEIISAVKTEENRVFLLFKHVYDKLDAFEAKPERLDFTVVDEKGENSIVFYELVDRDGILLQLSRPLVGTAVVHGGYEKDLPRLIPFDFATHLPMLSFYGWKITEET